MTYRLRVLAVIGATLIVFSDCSSSDEPQSGDADPVPTAATAEPDEATAEAAQDDPTPRPEQTDEPTPELSLAADTRTLLTELGNLVITTFDGASEGGSHPMLSWNAVDDAATYWLVLRDSSGAAYWDWTGVETSVRVGGGLRNEENQTAVLHETMTWSVAAFDTENSLVGLSASETVTP